MKAAEMTGTRQDIDTGTDELLCHTEQLVGVITLNRPEARNSLSDNLSPALRRMIAELGADASVGAVMITGAGTAFCAGGNVKGMGDNRAPLSIEEAEERLKERQRTLTGALMAMRKPTIAVLPGPAIGAGLSLALACDLRIMAQSAFVGTGYVRVGLSGDYGIAWMLTSLLGSARARELMFTGARVDAATCERLGLANRIVADDRLQEEAFAFAKELADGPSVALGLIKDNLNWATGHDFLSALDHEAENMIQAGRTADHKEAVRAFIEKRKPVFGQESS